MRRKTAAVVLAAVMSAALAAACGSADKGNRQNPEGREEIMVAAAASLEYAFEEELIPMFEESYPAYTVTGTYDSSGKLQTQIEEGLEADLFFSAATKQMDALTEKGLIDPASVTELLENKIVLITPAQTELKMDAFTDLVKADTIAIGDPDSVPAGQYAKEALRTLGLWEQVEKKASLGTNVTEVLSWVAEGSAQAGIVYATDAATTDKVRIVADAPADSLAEPAVYPAGIVAETGHREAAEKFLEFLESEEAAAVFETYGFVKR